MRWIYYLEEKWQGVRGLLLPDAWALASGNTLSAHRIVAICNNTVQPVRINQFLTFSVESNGLANALKASVGGGDLPQLD